MLIEGGKSQPHIPTDCKKNCQYYPLKSWKNNLAPPYCGKPTPVTAVKEIVAGMCIKMSTIR